MNNLYVLCKNQIEKGKINNLQVKLDAFYLGDRISESEYSQLTADIIKTALPQT